MSKESHPPHEVREGQTWADNDPRAKGRTLRVESIVPTDEGGYAVCKVLTVPLASRAGRRRRLNGQVRIALRRFKPNRNGYRLISEPSRIGKSAKERAEEVAGLAGIPHTVGSAFLASVERLFKEHARDQRHLCAESVPAPYEAPTVRPNPLDAHSDALLSAFAAVMNAPEPGMHNG